MFADFLPLASNDSASGALKTHSKRAGLSSACSRRRLAVVNLHPDSSRFESKFLSRGYSKVVGQRRTRCGLLHCASSQQRYKRYRSNERNAGRFHYRSYIPHPAAPTHRGPFPPGPYQQSATSLGRRRHRNHAGEDVRLKQGDHPNDGCSADRIPEDPAEDRAQRV